MCLWLNLNRAPFDDLTFAVHNGNPRTDGYGIVVQQISARIGIFNGGGKSAFASYSMPLGQWHHVCATTSKVNEWTIFADGQPAGQLKVPGTLSRPQKSFVVGGNGITHVHNLDGKIDQVVVWNAVLSSAEMVRVGAVDGVSGSEPSCALYLPLNDGRGVTSRPASPRRGRLEPTGTFSWDVRQCTAVSPGYDKRENTDSWRMANFLPSNFYGWVEADDLALGVAGVAVAFVLYKLRKRPAIRRALFDSGAPV
eukprot:TRINITY_DN27239_c0_g1_i1.p1 TRINITY_DN27239_c0_g1~~TRINITY_DN27239_c0_g1_i1.p1  ORF type:complete len:253 (-),score=57.44 TRINITY_DN27239_c0_g1_i1:198-956(-)